LPIVSGKKVIKTFKKLGFYQTRQKGDHVILRKDKPQKAVVSIPLHKTLAPGTLLGILSKVNLTKDDFIKLLKKKL
jgi:predicted RNA binding protein YcfA (HicA-like mRNA interferase family)